MFTITSHAATFSEDFDDQAAGTTGTSFNFSGGLASSMTASTTGYISSPNSLAKYANTSISDSNMQYSIGSTTHGIATFFFNSSMPSGSSNFIMRTKSNSQDHDEISVWIQRNGTSGRVIRCGQNSEEYLGGWEEDTLYEIFLEWKIDGGETIGRCGVRLEGILVWSTGYKGVGQGYDPVNAIYFTSGTNSGYKVFMDNFYVGTDADHIEGGTTSGDTRIVSFSPDDDELVASTTVDIDMHVFVHPDDISTLEGVHVSLHNIDQNYLLGTGILFGDDIWFVDENLDTAGDFYFSTSTILATGNYRLEACIERTWLFNLIQAPFSDINDCQSHQFIVGTSTFLGNLSQNTFNEFDDFVNGLSATSSEALARTCNPIGDFDIRKCSLYLFIPSGEALKDTLNSLRDGILVRFPWGYFTRFIAILSSSNESALPNFTVNIRMSETSTTSVSINPTDMLAGGAAIVANLEDPVHGQTIRSILEPLVQLGVGLGVLFTIVSDLIGSHKHAEAGGTGRGRRQLS